MFDNSQSQTNPQNVNLHSTSLQTPASHPITSSNPIPDPPPSPQLPTQTANTIIQQTQIGKEQDQKPAGITLVLSVIFFIFGLMSMMSTFVISAIIIILNRSLSSATGFNYEIFKFFPSFGIFIIFLATTTFCVFYSAIKIKGSSKKGFLLGIISSVLLMIGPLFLTVLMLDPISSLMRESQVLLESSGSALTKTLPQNSTLSNIFKAIITDFFYIISFILLVVSFNKFHIPDKALSKVSKMFFLLLFLFFFLPMCIFTFSAYWQAFHPNLRYNEMQSKVDFHIYKPKKFPESLSYATIYRFNERNLVGKKNVVFVAISAPLTEMGKKKPMITINQVGVEPSFDMLSYLSTVDTKYIKEVLEFPKTIDKKAYYTYNPSSPIGLKSIVFETKDHVFISIAGVRTKKEDLLQLAESLE